MRITVSRGVLLAAAMSLPVATLPADAAPAPTQQGPAVAIATADASSVMVPGTVGAAAVHAELPARAITLSIGSGQLIRLPRAISGLFVADEKIADVNVKSPTQVYLFAKAAGETSIFATDRSGAVVWSSSVRVGNNIAGVGAMLRAAMPENDINVVPLGANIVLLTGTVLSPKDAEEAQHLAELYTGGACQILNHLKIATPQQVSLQVKIAEVSRSVSRSIGLNYKTADGTGGFIFGLAQGRSGAISDDLSKFTHSGVGTTLALGGKLLGVDIRQVLDLAETDGLVTTLAEPNLTAMSGETASFLAGGEIPIPQSQGLGTVSVDFKQYGVSLSFTPTVMSNGRISMRVRPEVSQLSDSGSVKLNGFTIPALTTRRIDTTVELGSGQSFVIGGLLQNDHNNSTDKAPILGDLPVLGALFRSNGFRKQETELVVVVTPYIVKPVDANQIALPTDGYRSATTAERILGDKSYDGKSGARRPMPSPAPALPAPASPSPAGVASGSQP
ncbi:type II and III secretion system protein family protein [Sphingomonas bacterium]|uniref:type II and III secretion system protein family protein n=1 Tax=Sphingomonas bacterium TaxID=1895847 RepID=UPI0020C6E5F5|nr:type II and III secretion system protein family protein [Sphingomonas bacterium]